MSVLTHWKGSVETGNGTNYMTKYVELVPLQNIRATTIADALINHVICRHEIPNVLHSDRGTSYLVNIVRETCKLLNIKKHDFTQLITSKFSVGQKYLSVFSQASCAFPYDFR
jgi:hypothetical protein